MRIIIISGLLLSLFSCAKKKPVANIPQAYQVETVDPEILGFSADSLSKIDDIVQPYIDAGVTPGVNILVARHGQIAFEKSYGYADLEQKIPLNKDHIFRMASMTKPVTSIAILQLHEHGKLDINDPLSKYFPGFAETGILDNYNADDTTWTVRPANREITIAHLLNHTSGIAYGFMNQQMAPIYAKLKVVDAANKLDYTIQESVSQLAKAPLLHHPGEKWTYGLSTDVLGAVVEKASGMSLGDYFQKNIFEPLGILNTAFWFPDSINSRLTTLYQPQGDTAISPMQIDENPLFSPDFPIAGAKKYYSGGSGLSGTARDYFVICQSLLNDGSWNNRTILTKNSSRAMHTNQIDTITYPWGAEKFGFGFSVYPKDENQLGRRAGRYSWGGAFSTNFWIDPARDMVVVILRQVVFDPNGRKMDGPIEAQINKALVNSNM